MADSSPVKFEIREHTGLRVSPTGAAGMNPSSGLFDNVEDAVKACRSINVVNSGSGPWAHHVVASVIHPQN